MTTHAIAEVTLQRRAAVRDLMACGATRAEAEAAIQEELGYALHRTAAPAIEELGRAVGKAFVAAAQAAAEVARAFGAALGRAHTGQVPPWQVPAGRRRRDYGLVR
ncbi:hypothetical protein [Pseudonocardia sp. NPDC049635]|uniref:hypothetical protein n=1 Tax=Pseudonocardia sp. NPDC049635 TaxID=3155506 RepID=UPI0033E673A1